MLSISNLTSIINGVIRNTRGWVYTNRYPLLTSASVASGLGAVIYMDVTTEDRAKMIQEKREEVRATQNRELTVFERATADLPKKLPGYAMAGGSSLIQIGTTKHLLNNWTAAVADAALARKENNELTKAIDSELSPKDAGKVKQKANEEAVKSAADEGKLKSLDAIPSVGRGSTIVLYKPAGLLFKADVNDIRRAYDQIAFDASNGRARGVATRMDLLHTLCDIAHGHFDDKFFALAKTLNLEGWSIWQEGYRGADLDHRVDIENNLDDREGVYIPADKLGLDNLGMEPVLVLDDNAEVIPEEVWKRVYENGYDAY